MKNIGLLGLCFVMALAFGTAFAAERAAAAGISQEEAAAIAVSQLENGRIIHSEFSKRRGGRTRYEFVVVNDAERVEVDLDGTTGAVMELDRRPIHRERSAAGRGAAGDTAITLERAREIALAKTGGGEITKIEKDYKRNGQVRYEIEIYGADAEYELEIDANSGAIVEFKRELYDWD